MPELLLASTSPRRAMLMEQTNIAFTSVEPDFEEVVDESVPAGDLACVLALGKARSVLRRHRDAVVIGGDTFVVFQGRYRTKLDDVEEARVLLRQLSGNICSVVSGFAVVDRNREYSRAIETFAHMKQLSDEAIDSYLESGEWKDKASAVSISIIEKIDGEMSAALGLPVRELLPVLARFGIT